jgi:bifunctional ADP-heptose synthase (sugar kinase/adenylyltransferase)
MIYRNLRRERLEVGGAGIITNTIRILGTKVTYITLGNFGEFDSVIKDDGLDNICISDIGRMPTVKTRYMCDGELVFRLNDFDCEPISHALEEEIFLAFLGAVSMDSFVILSDFGYGLLTRGLIDRIISHCVQHSIEFAVDAQASSQIAELEKYRDGDYLFATEHEIRTMLGNFSLGIQTAANRVLKKLNFKNLILKLGADGALWIKNADGFPSTYIPSFAREARRVTGAGDVMLSGFVASYVRGHDAYDSIVFGGFAAGSFVETPETQDFSLSNINSLIDFHLHNGT